ncbi:probable aminopeptidase NPEPL1 isoform X1 [Phyllostomus hastatus]|uniref:probable aminopeptidase NPEPL1 isoform X1 n=1 Tax=Phyllostomus hastatus TaxID=9423 RepID=UPI001E6817BC|nr:probable aminopeptidase NPEPL1 isoform X1 [Phyllostomus hastatus]
MASVGLQFQASAGDADPQSRPLLLLGQLHHLHRVPWSHVRGKLQPRVTEELWQAALSTLNPNPTDSCPLYLNYATVAALPSRVSRHNSPSAAHFVTRLVRTCLPPGTHRCIVMACERSDVFASACALARAFPLFTHRSGASRRTEKKTVTVEFFLVGQDNGPVEVSTLQCLTNTTDSVRLAARIVDTPCNEMNTDTFLEEIKKVGKELGITPTIIRDEELKTRGFGGIYGVGKAALHPPALAVLSHTPDGATQTIAWVGKGIVYDTGGLSIKGKTTMPGMKRDCGGAAAILGAFRAAIKQGFKDNLHAVFCLAENAVGPNATRPDDIHLLYSGKTVEINNTDAEGRLVLADGVSYACKDLGADIILDMATLTGAQRRVGGGLREVREEVRGPGAPAGLLPGAALQRVHLGRGRHEELRGGPGQQPQLLCRPLHCLAHRLRLARGLGPPGHRCTRARRRARHGLRGGPPAGALRASLRGPSAEPGVPARLRGGRRGGGGRGEGLQAAQARVRPAALPAQRRTALPRSALINFKQLEENTIRGALVCFCV